MRIDSLSCQKLWNKIFLKSALTGIKECIVGFLVLLFIIIGFYSIERKIEQDDKIARNK